MFYEATKKGRLWNGVNNWDNQVKPVFIMTGITCNVHNHMIGITLKNRGLEERIINNIAHLFFL